MGSLRANAAMYSALPRSIAARTPALAAFDGAVPWPLAALVQMTATVIASARNRLFMISTLRYRLTKAGDVCLHGREHANLYLVDGQGCKYVAYFIVPQVSHEAS